MDIISAEILLLVKKKMAEQGAYDRNSYDLIVEEVIDYFKEKGKLTDEDNEQFIKDQLAEMFEAAKNNLADE